MLNAHTISEKKSLHSHKHFQITETEDRN